MDKEIIICVNCGKSVLKKNINRHKNTRFCSTIQKIKSSNKMIRQNAEIFTE